MEQLKNKTIIQQTITSRIVEKLRTDILSRQIPVGTHIKVNEIAERYGVSNMPVREAFFTLAAEKLIEMSPYKGAVVLPVDKRFITDIYEIQGALEELINVKAMPLLAPEDINQLEQMNRLMQAVEDSSLGYQEYLRFNEMFHKLVYEKCPNTFAVERWKYYYRLIYTLWINYEHGYDRIVEACTEHDELMTAFKRQDVEAVRRVMRIHTGHAKENFLQQYEQNNL